VGFVTYSPLGRGFLTRRFKKAEDLSEDDWRRRHPRFEGENFQRNQRLAEAVGQMARQKSCTPAQLALAWVLVQGEDIVPIPGTKRVHYLEENLAALQVSFGRRRIAPPGRSFPLGRRGRRALQCPGYESHRPLRDKPRR